MSFLLSKCSFPNQEWKFYELEVPICFSKLGRNILKPSVSLAECLCSGRQKVKGKNVRQWIHLCWWISKLWHFQIQIKNWNFGKKQFPLIDIYKNTLQDRPLSCFPIQVSWTEVNVALSKSVGKFFSDWVRSRNSPRKGWKFDMGICQIGFSPPAIQPFCPQGWHFPFRSGRTGIR